MKGVALKFTYNNGGPSGTLFGLEARRSKLSSWHTSSMPADDPDSFTAAVTGQINVPEEVSA
jgi:hypothetical protein